MIFVECIILIIILSDCFKDTVKASQKQLIGLGRLCGRHGDVVGKAVLAGVNYALSLRRGP